MSLTETQKRHLRGLAHRLRPCIHVGDAGVSPAVVAELQSALERHELLKVKIRAGDRAQRNAAIVALVEETHAVLVSRIGNVAILYRPSKRERRINLPMG